MQSSPRGYAAWEGRREGWAARQAELGGALQCSTARTARAARRGVQLVHQHLGGMLQSAAAPGAVAEAAAAVAGEALAGEAVTAGYAVGRERPCHQCGAPIPPDSVRVTYVPRPRGGEALFGRRHYFHPHWYARGWGHQLWETGSLDRILPHATSNPATHRHPGAPSEAPGCLAL